MRKNIALVILFTSIMILSGCSLVQELLKKSPKEEIASPYKQPEAFCTYFHYFRSDNFAQWWYPGKDPKRILGPEPWRRDLWLGRLGDYPYIGMYDNVTDGEIMRWHIRLAKASGITAFLLYMIDWQEQLPETKLMLDIAAQEGFKIGFVEHHSLFGGAPRGILDGRPLPIMPHVYEGYDRVMEQYYKKMGLPQPPEQTRYLRRLREIPSNALAQSSERISNMLNRWKSHPAYLRIDGKPIIMIPYIDVNLTPVDFKTLVGKIKEHVNEDLYVVAIVPSVYWYFYPPSVPNSGITVEWADTGVNSFTHWTPNGMLTASQKTRLKATQFNVKDSLKWKKDPMIPIMPGSDASSWRPGDVPSPPIPTDNGRSWTEQLDAAITAKPRFILIHAWNEWHEGSQIEPSTLYINPATKDSDPYLYLRILAQKMKKPWQAPPLPPKNSVDAKRFPYL